MEKNYDYIIVGARCAGAATAMRLARGGAKVLLVDRERKMGDTLSTHALMRPAVMMLDKWGLLDQVAQIAPAVTETQFHYGSDVLTVEIEPFGRAKGLYAPRRYALDAIMLATAAEAGADIELGVTCEDLIESLDGRITGARLTSAEGVSADVQATLVIGADGRNSGIAKMVDAPVRRVSTCTNPVIYGYFSGLDTPEYRWYFSEDVVGGIFPTSNGDHCAFIGAQATTLKALLHAGSESALTDGLSIWEPELAAQMAKTGPAERLHRFGGSQGHIKRCAGNGWALVGDAGYFKDPCTAHGISDAFLDAHRLSEALLQTPADATAYEIERDQYCDAVFEATQAIAAMDWSIEEVQMHHKTFVKAMRREIEGIGAQMELAA